MEANEIIHVAADLFQRQGYHATTVRQIAAELGVTSAALYYHFSSKEKILEAVFDTAMTTAEQRLQSLTASGELPEVILPKLIQGHVMAVMDELPLMTVFFNEMKHLPEQAGLKAHERQGRYRAGISAVLEEAIARGAVDDVDPGVTALAILGMCNWMHHWYRADGNMTAEEIGKLFSRIVTQGIMPRCGSDAPERDSVAVGVSASS